MYARDGCLGETWSQSRLCGGRCQIKTSTGTFATPAVRSLLIATSVVMHPGETDMKIVLHYSDTGIGPETLCL